MAVVSSPVDPFQSRLTRLRPPAEVSPLEFIHGRLGEHVWSKQRDVADSVVVNRRTAVKASHGVGKSWLAGRLVAWWIETHPPGTATAITTAPTFSQVRAILWKEINRAHKLGGLGGRTNQTEWLIGTELVAFGRKPSDYDQAAFQGIHDEFVLVVLDEAGGIPEQLWIDANALITNTDCRILAIGNPDDPVSHFAKVCQPGSGWNVITIAARHSPNFTGEEVPDKLRRVLVNQVYLDELAADVGEGSPIWQAKVEGEFPLDDPSSVVSPAKITQCRRGDQEHPPEALEPVELGVDVGASEGGDATVIRARYGCVAGPVWRVKSAESADVVDAVMAAIIETGAAAVKIDSIGVGWGVAGELERLRSQGRHSAHVIKVNVGQASTAPGRFPKLRDQIWWEVGRLHTEAGTWDLAAIDDRTAADLAAPRWAPDAGGRIKVEPKDETRKRLGRSPDDADALLLAFYAGFGQGAAFIQAWANRLAKDEAEAAAVAAGAAGATRPRPETAAQRRARMERHFAQQMAAASQPPPEAAPL